MEYEDFGNCHYGIVGRAAGIQRWILKRAAGLRQWLSGKTEEGWSNPFWVSPYDDDPKDHANIIKGIDYYNIGSVESANEKSVVSLYCNKTHSPVTFFYIKSE